MTLDNNNYFKSSLFLCLPFFLYNRNKRWASIIFILFLFPTMYHCKASNTITVDRKFREASNRGN